ncbi:hypothetical protein [Halorarum halobium]|uniref:hypothetical protein n=1 Tax=Halorarum halobium TaxID=3075121 RepID=UPI0028A8C13F|nr:hypothetical protein [Halobaculum sp. XH14]
MVNDDTGYEQHAQSSHRGEQLQTGDGSGNRRYLFLLLVVTAVSVALLILWI